MGSSDSKEGLSLCFFMLWAGVAAQTRHCCAGALSPNTAPATPATPVERPPPASRPQNQRKNTLADTVG